MINLIPAVVKKVITKEYRLRVASVFLFILSLVSLLTFVFFLPAYVLVSTQVDVYAKSASEAALQVADFDNAAKTLVNASQMSQKIVELRKNKKFSEVITLVEANQGLGIEIEIIELSRAANLLAPVKVNGRADTRQDLANFRDALLKLPEVADVILPISNLARDKNIQFNLSILLKPEGQNI